MKNLIMYISVIIGLLLIISCSKDEEKEQAPLSENTQSINGTSYSVTKRSLDYIGSSHLTTGHLFDYQ